MGVIRKKSVKKKRTVSRRKKKKKNSKSSFLSVRVFSFLVLFGLLLFSVGAAGYVIFFRTTIAHGATEEKPVATIVFEEPYPSISAPLPSSTVTTVPESSLPMVAIIIDDMGYHEKIGRKLLALPMELTFSFLAAAPFTAELEEMAFQAGRVVLLHQPMEPKGKEWDPGPGALLIGQSAEEQKALFHQNLRAVPHAVGVNNHMGSLYTEDRAAMDTLMQLIREEGLFFVDSFTSADSQAFIAARAAGIPAARRQIFLDNVQSQDQVCKQLQKLVKSAEENGWAIGIGHPNAATLAALTNCRGKLPGRVRLVSVLELLMKLYAP